MLALVGIWHHWVLQFQVKCYLEYNLDVGDIVLVWQQGPTSGDGDIHGQISATERKGGDTPGGSHAGVHRASPLGHGANRFTESDREGAVVGVSIPDGASTRDWRIEHLQGAVCEGVLPERAGGVFVDRTQLQEEKSSWPDDASPPSSPSLFTSSHGVAVCRRGIEGGCPPQPNSRAGCELSGGA